ncbi:MULTISPECIES: CYTH domain-containing protein [Maribacter]|uniref:CYTH domain-containing protein n=1 Tax=Maribacter flavus TaxID=1658664 RepID=A0A5B2TYN8_9FLAO|nr:MULTISPECIES: CYTH domain-containing protein [Maribacter]KAA2219419.1 CYTH domain-containing protein [Maribacter flavus]MDC6404356.1 CYTH domain-containing protein [Maribacter sp. PR66]MEE1971498.1 CYTH domain-containing protein [Maribacter flavus]
MIEIERKFLVKSMHFVDNAVSSTKIIQGFLNTHPERTVRIRIKEEKGFLTVKGKSNETGTTRFEWETEIAHIDAQKLLQLCEKGVLEKTRYLVPFEGHNFEVDVFDGENKGLILAEIELTTESELFQKPHWLGEEVTGDIKYYNSQLSKQPFNTW